MPSSAVDAPALTDQFPERLKLELDMAGGPAEVAFFGGDYLLDLLMVSGGVWRWQYSFRPWMGFYQLAVEACPTADVAQLSARLVGVGAGPTWQTTVREFRSPVSLPRTESWAPTNIPWPQAVRLTPLDLPVPACGHRVAVPPPGITAADQGKEETAAAPSRRLNRPLRRPKGNR